jgi:hypothetical protein
LKESLPLKCKCGKMKGVAKNISPSTGNHIVCMCIDCQTFAHYLKKEDEVLDQNGGTHIFQVTPSQIEINEGRENLALVRLSPKGAKRWYAKCCNTPVANTISFKMSFVGLIQNFIDFESSKIKKEQALGPITSRCMAKYAHGEVIEESHEGFPKLLTLKIMKTIFLGKLIKSYLPNTFFNETTGEPVVSPIILSKQERVEIQERILAKK